MKVEGCVSEKLVDPQEFEFEKQNGDVRRPSWSVAVVCNEFGGLVWFRVEENPENGELSISCASGACEARLASKQNKG